MSEVIEINYISPICNYAFDKAKRYYLVFIHSGKSDIVTINKMEIKNINNITDTIRSYHINKAIKLLPNYAIKLFEYDSDKIKLIFTGFLDTVNIEYGPHVINLNIPSKVLDNFRIGLYNDDTSFLQEQFYNFESSDANKCMLFITKTKMTKKPIMKPYHFNCDKTNDTYIYDRYNSTIIREQNFVGLDSFGISNTFPDYVKFIRLYNIDVNKYITKPTDTFRSMFMRKINPKFRPLNYEPYLNNIICSPVDGRVIGFNNVTDAEFKFYGNMYHVADLIKENFRANGFINRMSPYDYQRVHTPYSGYLTDFHEMNHCIVLKFESDYFIPPNVHEREYISVVYGHNVQMSREFPELVDKQPKTKLVFYIVLFCNKSSDAIILTHTNLINIRKASRINKIKIWFDQGEEIGVFNACLGTILTLFNRPIKFSDDIDFYSQKLNKQIESLIKAKDLIGLIQ